MQKLVRRPELPPADRPGHPAAGPVHQKPEGGAQDGLPAGDFQHRPEGVAVAAAEQVHHLHRQVILLRLQKAAVHRHRHHRPGGRGIGFQLLQKPHQGHRQAVGVEGEHQHQVGSLFQLLAQGGEGGGGQHLPVSGGAAPAVGQHLGINLGVGPGGPGAGVEDQHPLHDSTSFCAAASTPASGTKRTRYEAKFMFFAFRATSRRNSCCSSGGMSP